MSEKSIPDKEVNTHDNLIRYIPSIQQPSHELSTDRINTLRESIGQPPLKEGDKLFTDMTASLKKKSSKRKSSKRK